MLVIDGHNLVPKIPGLSLDEVDDEERLLALLQVYARVKRKKIEVFFDGAPPGQSGIRAYGTIRAHFVQAGRTADEAIRQHLIGLKKAARNITVVSTDRQVRDNARALHAQVISSEEFAAELVAVQASLDPPARKTGGKTRASPGSGDPSGVPAQEIDEWLKAFGIDPALAEKPIELLPKKKEPKPAGKKKPRAHHGFEKKD
ncbi:MAG: hypothetical protein EHM21_11590 [Chloroflexi bacterium]|nr:MAG: hypothetical protein EHM21_11590 [Chloroflexota bacterium]